MFEHYELEKERKKQMSKAEKQVRTLLNLGRDVVR
jgi:hypothetical protein